MKSDLPVAAVVEVVLGVFLAGVFVMGRLATPPLSQGWVDNALKALSEKEKRKT
jgi:hypothetical protein